MLATPQHYNACPFKCRPRAVPVFRDDREALKNMLKQKSPRMILAELSDTMSFIVYLFWRHEIQSNAIPNKAAECNAQHNEARRGIISRREIDDARRVP